MPLPRVRFTMRRMMVAVAVIAVLIAGIDSARKAILYSLLARRHEREAMRYAISFDFRGSLLSPESQRALIRYSIARRAYQFALSRKYEDAARRPWLPVAPDPPEPE